MNMSSGQEVMNAVLKYSQYTSRTIICNEIGIDYLEAYGSIAYYKNAPLNIFMNLMFGDTRRQCKSTDGIRTVVVNRLSRTWQTLVSAIPGDLPLVARYRCLQIVAELASAIFDDVKELFVFLNDDTKREMQLALSYFYQQNEHRTCEWMKAAAFLDSNAFSTIVKRIQMCTICLKTSANYKRALVYVHQLGHAKQRVYLDSPTGHSSDVLRKLRQAYEHVSYGRIPVQDFSHKHGLMKAMIEPEKAYIHSCFRSAANRKKIKADRQLVVHGDQESLDLILYGLPGKKFQYSDYLGALELMSSCGSSLDTVYVDRRVLNDIVLPDSHDFVFDASLLLPHLSKNLLEKQTRIYERLTRRTNDLNENKCFRQTIGSEVAKDKPALANVCRKEQLFEPTNDSCYERDNISSKNYTKDFLLWIIHENPMLI